MALEYLRNAEKLRTEFDCNLLREEMFITELSWNAFVFNNCYDRVGRPIFWLRIRNWRPETGTELKFVRFFCYLMDKIAVNMKPNTD